MENQGSIYLRIHKSIDFAPVALISSTCKRHKVHRKCGQNHSKMVPNTSCTQNHVKIVQIGARRASGSSKMAHDTTRWTCTGSQRPQDGPKCPPRGAKRAPRGALGPTRGRQGDPLGRPGRPKRRPRGPKRAPRWLKRGPRWPKWGPKWDLKYEKWQK